MTHKFHCFSVYDQKIGGKNDRFIDNWFFTPIQPQRSYNNNNNNNNETLVKHEPPAQNQSSARYTENM